MKPWCLEKLEFLSIDKVVIDALKSSGSLGRLDYSRLVNAFESSSLRVKEILAQGPDSSFGVREEWRMTFDLFEHLSLRLSNTPQVIVCPADLICLSSRDYFFFLERNIARFTSPVLKFWNDSKILWTSTILLMICYR